MQLHMWLCNKTLGCYIQSLALHNKETNKEISQLLFKALENSSNMNKI